jgi:hypothetical protein
MILDKDTRLGAAQAFTDADEKTTYSYDLGAPAVKRRIGTGTPLSLVFTVTTPAAGDSGSATDTIDFCVVEDSQADLSTSTVIQQRRVAAALLVVGAVVVVNIPPGEGTKQYIGGQVVNGTGDTISCNVDLIPTEHVPAYTAYAKGYSV